ncbi:MAG: radical SAM protein [Candidatus Moraniibacteriota bacterium]
MLLRKLPRALYMDPEKISTVQWHLTSRCEGDCRFCYMIDSPNYENELANELSLNQCLKIIQDYSLYLRDNSLEGCVQLTGGDPLIKNGFWEIVDALNKIGVVIAILGNHHLIDDNTARELKKRGVFSYQLSIDGTPGTHDFFRGNGSFEKTWRAARILRDNGIVVRISFTLSPKNYSEVEEVAEYCCNNKVNYFHFSRLVPEGKAKKLESKSIPPSMYRELIFKTIMKLLRSSLLNGHLVNFSPCDPLTFPLITGNEGNFLPLATKARLSFRRGCHSNFLTILPDGTLYVCRRLPIKIGNILNDTFEKALNSELARKLRNPHSYKECSACKNVALCQGGCPAISYAYKGDPFAKDPQCWVDVGDKKSEKFFPGFRPGQRLDPCLRGGDKKSQLFQPLKIGSLETKNRIFRSATLEGVANPDGSPSDKHLKIYEDLAKGECGLITTGIAYVSEDSKINPNQTGIHKNYLVDEWKNITEKVHACGGEIAVQITHQSAGTKPLAGESMAPSTKIYMAGAEKLVSREMTETEILTAIRNFREAAVRAKEANFDAVQLQIAHGYLLGQFLSPLTNQRTDRWGGNLENRLRIIVEILRGIRVKLDDNYPIMVKINSSDCVEGGLTAGDISQCVKILSAEGVKAFELSGWIPGAPASLSAVRTGAITGKEQECYFEKEAEQIRRNNPNIILGICGGIRSRGKMEELLEKGFDFVSLSRPFIREPGLVKKMRLGIKNESDCASCSVCFLRIRNYPLKCYLKHET